MLVIRRALLTLSSEGEPRSTATARSDLVARDLFFSRISPRPASPIGGRSFSYDMTKTPNKGFSPEETLRSL